MKFDLFLAIVMALIEPQVNPWGGERYYSGTYTEQTRQGHWLNISTNADLVRPGHNLYLRSLGIEDSEEKIILRVDNTDAKPSFHTETHVSINCSTKQAKSTMVVKRNMRQEVMSVTKVDQKEMDPFDDSHLYGIICASRALTEVLENKVVKEFDSCDFRQKKAAGFNVSFKHMYYTFPVVWNEDTCKAVKNAVWLYGADQPAAGRLRLYWVPALRPIVEYLDCNTDKCRTNINVSKFYFRATKH